MFSRIFGLKELLSAALSILASAGNACVFSETPSRLGEFEGNVVGQFITRPYATRPLFELSAPFVYEAPDGTRYVASEGYIVDGASIPQLAWSLIGGPFSGHHLSASVIHDYYTDLCLVYPHEEEARQCLSTSGQYYDDEVVHWNYYLGMLAEGVDEETACAEYVAVSVYKSWDLDGNSQPINVRIMGQPVGRNDANTVDRGVAFLRASIGAFFQTRRASGGSILNIFPDGQIPATPEGLQEYIARLRDGIGSELYRTDLDQLGLLTSENYSSLEELEVWPEGFLEGRFNPFTEQYEDLAYFQPGALNDQSALAEALNLTQRPAIVRDLPGEETIDAADFSEEAQRLILEFLESEGSEIPQWFGVEDIQVQPIDDGSGVQYQISPLLRDYMEIGGGLPDLGSNGTVILQQGLGGQQDLLVQPAPELGNF